MSLDSIYKGIVRDVNDPEGYSRIRLEVPQIFGPGGLTTWAWPVNSLGSSLPTLGAVVYVMFESGHEDSPVWFSGGGGLAGATTGGDRYESVPFTKTGDLTGAPGTSDFRFYLDRSATVTSFRASLGGVADRDVIVDLLFNSFDGGESILDTPAVIPAGGHTGLGSVSAGALNYEDYLTISIVQAGDVSPGSDLVCQVGLVYGTEGS